MTILSLCILLIIVLTLFYLRFQKSRRIMLPVLVSGVVIAISASVWFGVLAPKEEESKVVKLANPMTIDEILEEIQGQLMEDRNNPDLWFQLGQGYFANGEFENADTCFGYVIRLTDEPSSTVFAAKATALYYVHSQRMTEEVRQLLEIALRKDQFNDTALMLIANDHFISFRYDDAIATWQKVLDSERTGIDRVAVINSINNAKELRTRN